jgi:hypothetical protein
MSARKSVRQRRAAPPKRTPSNAQLPKASSRQKSPMLASAESVLDECIAAVSLVDVTVHALESRELASSEQEVLKRALEAIWFVHDWIDGLELDDLCARVESREVEP